MPTTDQLEKGFTLGEWEVLPQKGVLRRGDEEVRPEPKVFDVLLALARRDRDLVTKDELIAEVWDGRAFGDEPIQRCIALLRKHFGDSRPYEYIETLQRRGYRLLKPVELRDSQEVLSVEPAQENGDTRLWKIVAAVVAAGFIVTAALTWLPEGKEPAVRSIAILPMDNLSGDPANRYLVDGIKNTLAVRLSELQDFTIKNVRVFPVGPSTEVARDLNVESVLYGSLQKQGEMLKVTWIIVEGSDNVTVGSGEVTGTVDGVFELQEKLAQVVRDELAGSETPQLVTRPAPASAAYNSFMRGMYLLERRGDLGNLEAAIELFEESIELDPDFGPAYLQLACSYALLPDYRNSPLEETHRLAIETVEAGIAVDPSIEDAAASIYGFVYHQQKRWQESEEAHLRAVNAQVVDANSFNWYSRMLSSVGRREDATRWALAAENIDPDNPVVNNRIALTYLWQGETQKAEEYFERAGKLGSGGRNQLLGHALLLMRLGKFEQAENLALAGTLAEEVPVDWVKPAFAAFADPEQSPAAFEILDRQWEERTLAPQVVFIARAVLGDIDGAMEIAQLLRMPGEVFEMDLLFIPELEALRQHPDFLPLMRDLGVLDYWETVGCEWSGSQVSCPTG